MTDNTNTTNSFDGAEMLEACEQFLQEAVESIATREGRSPSKLTKKMRAEAEEMAMERANTIDEAIEMANSEPLNEPEEVPVAKAAVKISKKAIAGAIFGAMVGEHRRKDIIAAMIEQAHLTDHGAATYYQNFNSGAWDY